MVNYSCSICNYHSQNMINYEKHLKTQKHLKKCPQKIDFEQKNEGWEPKNEGWEPNEEGKSCNKKTEENQNKTQFFVSSKQFFCHYCQKKFSREDNLRRHLSVCKLSMAPSGSLSQCVAPTESQHQNSLICSLCGLVCSKRFNLNRHIMKCVQQKKGGTEQEIARLKEIIEQQESQHQYQKKELEVEMLKQDLKHKDELLKQKDETIKIAKESKQVIHNTTNKTINYLDSNYGDMIAMSKFLYNLEHHEQLTHHERELLLMSYKENGIDMFARSFSHIMKENCRRQLLKEGLPDWKLLPLFCSDGNLRSHKEKGAQGWKTHYDNQSINKMINISTEQVYESHQQPLPITGRNIRFYFYIMMQQLQYVIVKQKISKNLQKMLIFL